MNDLRDVANFIEGPHGQRPPLDALPTDTPPGIVDMIQQCWHFDRTKRMSSMQCLGIVHQCRDIFANKVFDIFLSYKWTNKCFVRYLYKLLVSSGYRVWFDENEIEHNMTQSMQRGIERSKVVLACVSPEYQIGDNTMFELRYARNCIDPESGLQKPLVTVVLEEKVLTWANAEVKLLCDIRSPGGTMYVNLSSVAKNYPNNEAAASVFHVSNYMIHT